MSTLYLEERKPGVFRGWWNDELITVKREGENGSTRISVRAETNNGDSVFGYSLGFIEEAMQRLLEDKGCERIAMRPLTGNTAWFTSQVRVVPSEEIPEGYVRFEYFDGAFGPEEESGFLTVHASEIERIEYLRVGRKSGSMLYMKDSAAHPINGEPGATLMSVFRVSPKDAARISGEDYAGQAWESAAE